MKLKRRKLGDCGEWLGESSRKLKMIPAVDSQRLRHSHFTRRDGWPTVSGPEVRTAPAFGLKASPTEPGQPKAPTPSAPPCASHSRERRRLLPPTGEFRGVVAFDARAVCAGRVSVPALSRRSTRVRLSSSFHAPVFHSVPPHSSTIRSCRVRATLALGRDCRIRVALEKMTFKRMKWHTR